MRLKDRLAGIDAHLDDLQAGVEACARAAGAIHADAARFDTIIKRIKNLPLIASLLKRSGDLEDCAREQQSTLRELREHIDRLQQELNDANFAVKPARYATATERRR